jgi:dolichol-phosphate mannosyltransferase
MIAPGQQAQGNSLCMNGLSGQWAGSDLLAVLHRKKIIGFFLIGLFSTIIDIGFLYLLTQYFGIWYMYSATISYTCGMVVNFLLNKHLNFQDTNRDYLRQFCSFALISMSSLALTLGILYVTVEIFSINYLVGKIIAVIIAFFWNYFGQSRITFRLGTCEMRSDMG